MKLDEQKRELIEKKKENERLEAIKTIFSEEQSKSSRPKPEDSDLVDNAAASTETFEKPEATVSTSAKSSTNQKASKKTNEIWDESTFSNEPVRQTTQQIVPVTSKADKPAMIDGDANEEPPKPKVLPAVRNSAKQENIKLEFTEKIFPTLALRESQFKEAPAPKLRKLAQKMDKVTSSDSESRKYYQKPNLAKGQRRRVPPER
jgi:hypothetical protein